MAKNILPEISNWINTGEEIYHDFKWVTTYEKRVILHTLKRFLEMHPEYKVTELVDKTIRVCKKV